VLDGSEKLNDENVKRLVDYFVEVARKLKENFKEERERVLGIMGAY
jgi:S-methylmethionine-dependent homocysteine/selenocysteine methylase